MRRGPPVPRARPAVPVAGRGHRARASARCSSAPTSAASGCTWRCCPAASTGALPQAAEGAPSRRQWVGRPGARASRPRLTSLAARERTVSREPAPTERERCDERAGPRPVPGHTGTAAVAGGRGAGVRLPRRAPGAARGRPAHRARRAGRAARPQRGRQDDAGAAPQRHPARPAPAASTVGGLAGGARDTCGRSAAGSASSSRTPTTSCSCRRSARTSRSARPTSASPAPRCASGSTPRSRAVGMLDAPRPLPAAPVRRAAPPGRAGHRAGLPAGDPRARRAVVQPRPGGPPRAGRGAARASRRRGGAPAC